MPRTFYSMKKSEFLLLHRESVFTTLIIASDKTLYVSSSPQYR